MFSASSQWSLSAPPFQSVTVPPAPSITGTSAMKSYGARSASATTSQQPLARSPYAYASQPYMATCTR